MVVREGYDLNTKDLIRYLASNRPDVVSVRKRKALIAKCTDAVVTYGENRQRLAEDNDFRISFPHGYNRIATLCCNAINAENDNDILLGLCKLLCRCIQSAPSIKLLKKCKAQLLPVDSVFQMLAEAAEQGSLAAFALAASPNWSIFVKHAFGESLASQEDIIICGLALKQLDLQTWEDTVGPAVVLKLKAKPDTVIPAVEEVTKHVQAQVLRSFTVFSEITAALLKQLKSSKDALRDAAGACFKNLAILAMQLDDNSAKSNCIGLIVDGLAEIKSIASAHQRLSVYAVFSDVAKAVNHQPVLTENSISAATSFICSTIAKETKTAKEAREAGLEALIRWIVICKRGPSDSRAYEDALAFIRKPFIAKNGADSIEIFTAMVTTMHPDILESIAEDLWKETKFSAGLEAFVETAIKKSSSSNLPQIEGLIAVYIILMHTSASSAKNVGPLVEKVLSSTNLSEAKTSFLFAQSMVNATTSNRLVRLVLPRVVVLCTKYKSNQREKENAKSSNIQAMVSCITHPESVSSSNANQEITTSLKAFLDYRTQSDQVLRALFERANALSLDCQEIKLKLDATRQARQSPIERLPIKGQCITNSHDGMDSNAVRRAAAKMAEKCKTEEGLAIALVLMHIGTSMQSDVKQRNAVVKYTKIVLAAFLSTQGSNVDSFSSTLVSLLVQCALSAHSAQFDGDISQAIHIGAVNLSKTIGLIHSGLLLEEEDKAGDEDGQQVYTNVALKRCINICSTELPKHYGKSVKDLLKRMELLTDMDIAILRSPKGTLVRPNDGKGNGDANSDSAQRNKNRMTEEEIWEEQIRKELALKKGDNGKSKELSGDDKQTILEQDEQRQRVSNLVNIEFKRTIFAIEQFALCDIEIGNGCIPILGPGILKLSVSTCAACRLVPSVQNLCTRALTTLSACVYEIQEENAAMIASALKLSCASQDGPQVDTGASFYSSSELAVQALPSPCEAAATAIFEMDEYMEELSASSFAFLFPVVRAALTGPRTTPGCEAALRVLERHTVYLGGSTSDAMVLPMRKDMIVSVLELLQHDRAQAFTDPSPFDVLVACYFTGEGDDEMTKISTAEISPLLDERGALGPRNCRLAAMTALRAIAEKDLNMIKKDPLIESRIWVNSFDADEKIRAEARKTWKFIHGMENVDGIDDDTSLSQPSPLYAIPLLPLFDHKDPSVARAAAKAFANGMASHSASVDKNIQKLCSTYVEAFPAPADGKESIDPFAQVTLPKMPSNTPPTVSKKKPMGVPASLKKKTTKKSALQVAGIGMPKKATKKKVHSALLKPKQERKLDTAELVSQFQGAGAKVPAEKDSPKKIGTRTGVLRAITEFTSAKITMDISALNLLTSFLIAFGLADPDKEIKGASRNALRDIVATFGGSDEAISVLLPALDKVLKTGGADRSQLDFIAVEKIPLDADASDSRKEGAVVALGSVALHLKGTENAGKIDATIDMLMQSLKTPNEDVQSSVADCLAKLMKKGNTGERIESLLEGLLNDCLAGDTSSMRRGGAHGLAAAVKGTGLASLKKFGIVARLEEACSNGDASGKEGSLFAIEMLCSRLGLLFEPYVKILLPSLLKSFSDPSDHVRKAASRTAGIIMSKLSAHGVKIVMPSVLTAFEDSSWRTKQASIAMLGSMSHLAPKQLASALPKVVPKLTEAFGDTHPKVKSSAQEALNEISKVVKNPEISSVSQILLKALTDPAASTVVALEALIETEFLHAIDAPSLALIVPILHRGLRDRGATTKRYGALIAGNICTMINDPRDFVPYLPILMPDLKTILLDPIPDVRSISARALGSLIRGLGEDTIPELRPWMLERLRSDEVSSAERSGAAQGLTEILMASGNALVEHVMLEDILPLRNHPQPSTREGVLWVLVFMPPSLGQGFTVLLDASLPALIGGLSDDNEQVREVAMRAGRVLIKSHGRVHVNKILPILENGMGDEDYRIRLSSLLLIGDLLSMIGGTSILKSDGDTQDDARRAERAQAQITLSLGMETRNRVLSGLYLARNDSYSSVRHSAIQVWKTIVSVTPRTLRQILPVLVTKIVTELASGDPDKTEMAGKCLGDIVSKLGDTVLPEIIPVLRNALRDGDNFTRRGVCVGLSEVLKSSTKDQILKFIDIVVKVVQDALCDDDQEVRSMASSSFQNLHSLVGGRAMDEVVPALMVALESDASNDYQRARALNGITGILGIRSRELLPYIIPKLIEVPITLNHAKALSGIATVTGDTIHYHFNTIIPAIMHDLSTNVDKEGDERVEAVRECAICILEHTEERGINWLVGEIASKCNSDKPEMRKESCWMLQSLITARKDEQDFFEQVPIMIRELVHRFNDDNVSVLRAAHASFVALSKTVPAEELVKHVEFMRNIIASMVSDARRRKGGVGDGEFLLPGFNMPKGLEPLLPIYQRGILYGSPIIREASACGLGEVISLTATKYLAGPLIIKMTGPLLRIVGDRNPANVKVAILKTLGLILTKGGPALRAFVPQFQTTFVKALSDPSRQVRREAISALALLMPLTTRVDPLIKELVSGATGRTSATSESAGIIAVQTATSEALAIVLSHGGKKVKLPDSVSSSLAAGKDLIVHTDEGLRESGAKVIGAASDLLGAEMAQTSLREIIQSSDSDSSEVRHGKACTVRRVMSAPVSREFGQALINELLDFAVSCIGDDKQAVKGAGCSTLGAVIGRSKDPTATLRKYESKFLSIMENEREPMEVHQAVAKGLALCLTLSQDDIDDRVNFLGLKLLNTCLKLAMQTSQRVQFAFNDVLYLALDVQKGEGGLNNYASRAMFDSTKQMKSLYTKVLQKIKIVAILED